MTFSQSSRYNKLSNETENKMSVEWPIEFLRQAFINKVFY